MKPGDRVQDRYELEEPLGSGGMAEVWLAHDARLQRRVAIKLLAPHFADDPDNLVRFFTEAQWIARIQHPNVVTVWDFGELEGRPFLVMEHAVGGPLADKIGDPFIPERACEIIGKVAAAAGAAHDHDIVHRDIKPGNILLDEDGNPKLADFGIASSRQGEKLTATGAAIGSPHYISPEQAAGGSATARSDIYALGVVLYELLTGRKPFDADNITAVVIAHVEQQPDPPSTHIDGIEPDVDALVLKCLAKDPAERFSNGSELASALAERWVDSTARVSEAPRAIPAGAAADLPGPRPQRFSKRAITVAGLVVILATAIVGWTVLDTGEPPGPPDKATAEEKRRPGENGGRRGEKAGSGSSEEPTRDASPSPADEDEAAGSDDDNKREGGGAEPTPTPTPEPTATPTPEPSATPTPEPTEGPGPDGRGARPAPKCSDQQCR